MTKAVLTTHSQSITVTSNNHICYNYIEMYSHGIFNYIALNCTALHFTALHNTVQHCTALYYTALYYTALHCTGVVGIYRTSGALLDDRYPLVTLDICQ